MYSIRKTTLARSARGTFFLGCASGQFTTRLEDVLLSTLQCKYYMSFEDLYIVIVIFFPCETRYPIRHMQCYYEE